MPRPASWSAREAWGQYTSIGRLSGALLRPPVLRSWERAHDGGASPLQFRAQTLSLPDTEQLLARQRSLIEASASFMRALSQAAGAERHAVMLGDRDANVLDVIGDEQSVHGPQSVPGPGSLLSEPTSGSNGVGTPLAEGGYVHLVGPEHFIGGFHPFTCQGIPIRDRSQVIGVLSTSVRRLRASRRLHDILVCAAHGIESELLCRRLQDQIIAALGSGADQAVILENLRQDVAQAHAAAKLRLQTAARAMKNDPRADTLELIATAHRAIVHFRRDAERWLELASSEGGMAQPLDLRHLTLHMISLLETERQTRRVELSVEADQSVVVLAERRHLLREFLATFLRATEAAGPGGAVQVRVVAAAQRSSPRGAIVFLAQPGPAAGDPGGPTTFSLVYPQAESPHAEALIQP